MRLDRPSAAAGLSEGEARESKEEQGAEVEEAEAGKGDRVHFRCSRAFASSFPRVTNSLIAHIICESKLRGSSNRYRSGTASIFLKTCTCGIRVVAEETNSSFPLSGCNEA